MSASITRRNALRLLWASAPIVGALTACSSTDDGTSTKPVTPTDTTRYIVAIEDEPDTVDFQCTSIYYTIACNVFDRLVETDADADGNILITPSLAKSWEVSDDGRVYTFHLQEGVTFSNGSPLTSYDVLYTFNRLLTHPDSCNRDIAYPIVGSDELAAGTAKTLAGFETLDDLSFSLTLKEPFEAFLACLSMPGASILDAESVEASGGLFGKEPNCTIGTGPFILTDWQPSRGMTLVANKNCWSGAPKSEGLDLRFVNEPEEVRQAFDNGELDVLDLDEIGSSAEYYIHGDIYQDRILKVPRLGICYIALNESIAPFDDVRVRKALQLALDRPMLLDAVYSGLGTVEHGIYPHGLYGFNPDLPEIPFDQEQAKALLAEAGYEDGLELTFTVKSSSAQVELTLVQLAATMWEDVGVHCDINVISEDEFMSLRKSGQLPCYTAMWTADYDDPDNFVYTFFGNRENTTFRSICYPKDDVMERVRRARTIIDPDERIAEYRELERIIIQEDAAWIPLLSRQRVYVTSERIEGLKAAWNGSVKITYRVVSLADEA